MRREGTRGEGIRKRKGEKLGAEEGRRKGKQVRRVLVRAAPEQEEEEERCKGFFISP